MTESWRAEEGDESRERQGKDFISEFLSFEKRKKKILSR